MNNQSGIPEKVRILGQDFKVIFKPDKSMRDALGLCKTTQNIINLRTNMNFDKRGEVFVHEVIHAIAENLNMGLTEDQVNNLAVGLWSFLKENGYVAKMDTNRGCKAYSEIFDREGTQVKGAINVQGGCDKLPNASKRIRR